MTRQTLGVTGLAAAGLHFGCVLYVVALILFAHESDWPMYWLLMLYLDALLALLWMVSLLLALAFRAPRVGTVLIRTAAGLVRRVVAMSGRRKAAIVAATCAAELLVAANAMAAGTLDRIVSVINFLFPLTFFGILGGWLIASATVNSLRVWAAIVMRLGRPGIRE